MDGRRSTNGYAGRTPLGSPPKGEPRLRPAEREVLELARRRLQSDLLMHERRLRYQRWYRRFWPWLLGPEGRRVKEGVLRSIIRAGMACVIALALLLQPGSASQRAAAYRVLHWLPSIWVTGYDQCCITASGTQVRLGVCAALWGAPIPRDAWVRIPTLHVTCRVEDTGGGGPYWVDVWEPTAAACYAITGRYRAVWWR